MDHHADPARLVRGQGHPRAVVGRELRRRWRAQRRQHRLHRRRGRPRHVLATSRRRTCSRSPARRPGRRPTSAPRAPIGSSASCSPGTCRRRPPGGTSGCTPHRPAASSSTRRPSSAARRSRWRSTRHGLPADEREQWPHLASYDTLTVVAPGRPGRRGAAHGTARRRRLRRPRPVGRRHRRADPRRPRRPLPRRRRREARRHVEGRGPAGGAVGADGQGRRPPRPHARRHRRPAPPDAPRRRGRVVAQRGTRLEGRQLPVRRRRLRAVGRRGRDEHGDRSVLPRPHDGLGAIGLRRAVRLLTAPAGVEHPGQAAAGAAGGLDDLRAARARLLDRRRDRAGRPPRRLPRLHRHGERRHAAPPGAGDGRAQHGPPAAGVRHRHHPGAAGRPVVAGVRSRVVRSRSGAAAGVRHRGGRRRRLQLGLRPVALHDPGGVLRDRPGRRHAHARVPPDGRRPQPGRAARRHGRRVQPHDGGGPGSQERPRPGRARLLPPAVGHRCRRDVDVLRQHGQRAPDDAEADGRLGRHVGP